MTFDLIFKNISPAFNNGRIKWKTKYDTQSEQFQTKYDTQSEQFSGL